MGEEKFDIGPKVVVLLIGEGRQGGGSGPEQGAARVAGMCCRSDPHYPLPTHTHAI